MRKPRRGLWLTFVIGAGACRALAPSPAGAQETAAEAVQIYRASVRTIQTIHCRTKVVTGRDFGGVKGLKRDESGRVVVAEAERTWDVVTDHMRREGSLLQVHGGAAYYAPQIAAYDGERFRGYNPDPAVRTRLGGIIAPYDNSRKIFYTWVPDFLGYAFVQGPARNLWDLLDGAKLVTPRPKDTPEHLVVLDTTYTEFGEKQNEARLRVWLDSTHGFLPARAEAVRVWSGTIDRELEVQEFAEPCPGVWVPVRGFDRGYYIDSVLPRGMTRGDLSHLTTDEFLAKGGRYVGRPLGSVSGGFYPDTVIVDPNTLRVNELIDPKVFTVEFPKGLAVLDTFRVNRSDVAPRVGEPIPVPARADSPFVRLLLGFNAVLLTLVLALYVRLRIRRRHLTPLERTQ